MLQTKMKHEKYADEIISANTTTFRLRQILKELGTSLKAYPGNAQLQNLVGIIYVRIGQMNEGIKKLRYAVTLEGSTTHINNLINALLYNKQYDEAWQTIQDNSIEDDLFTAIICDKLNDFNTNIPNNLISDLRDTCRLIMQDTPYGSNFQTLIDDTEEEVIVDIDIVIPSDIENVLALHKNFIPKFKKVCSQNNFFRIIPRFIPAI